MNRTAERLVVVYNSCYLSLVHITTFYTNTDTLSSTVGRLPGVLLAGILSTKLRSTELERNMAEPRPTYVDGHM